MTVLGAGARVSGGAGRGGGRSSDVTLCQSRLSVPLFNDERPDVVAGLIVVLGVGSVAVRELKIKLQLQW